MTLGLLKSYTPSSGQTANSTNYNTDVSALFNAFSGLEAQTSTLGALTITPSANSTTILRVNNAAGTELISVDTTNSSFKIKATGKVYLDGGSNTYIVESAADKMDFYCNGTNVLRLIDPNLGITATAKFYLDGVALTGNTYIAESAADKITLTAGGSDAFVITDPNIGIAATGKIYLDGVALTGNTYIHEGTGDNVSIVAGGTTCATFNTTSIVALQGIRIGDDDANKEIDDASGGTGSTTLYIGNAAITVASDKRIKKNIEDTKIKAIDILEKLRIVDFEWNDPSDTAINNRNARGKWTAMIAQEVVDIIPFVVNAPRPEGKDIDYNSEDIWRIEYENLVPILIKAIQELNGKIKGA